MGYSISWLAIREKPDNLVSSLGLKPTGKKAECAEEPYTGQLLPNGWFLLVLDKCEHKFIAPETLARLSETSEVIACTVEEHVMASTSELWKGGTKVWGLEHDAQQSFNHLKEHGALPESYAHIKDSHTKMQDEAGGKEADTDYFFDIPLATAKSIVGFKHDEDSGLEDGSFEVLEDLHAPSKSWWKLW